MAEVVRTSIPNDIKIGFIKLTMNPSPGIEVQFLPLSGNPITMNIPTEEATPLLIALNKANLANKSLVRRIYELAIQKGAFQGTIEGVPD